MSHIVDRHVGQKVRVRRWELKMGQRELADMVGIHFQQLHKYETAENRISASRLWDIAGALEVHISYFFEGLMEQAAVNGAVMDSAPATKEAVDLVRSMRLLPELQRRHLLELASALGGMAREATAPASESA